MRVVLDTNIYISGLFFGGIPRKILDLVEEKFIAPCFIIKTFTELERLLYHEKFIKQRNLLSFSIADFLNKLKSYSLIFPQPSKIPIIIKKDLPDNYFLACAILSQASFIVSGDRHLLKLREFRGIPIVLPREFLKSCQNPERGQAHYGASRK